MKFLNHYANDLQVRQWVLSRAHTEIQRTIESCSFFLEPTGLSGLRDSATEFINLGGSRARLFRSDQYYVSDTLDKEKAPSVCNILWLSALDIRQETHRVIRILSGAHSVKVNLFRDN